MLTHGAERAALRGQLAQAQAQLRALEAQLRQRTTHDPQTHLLVLDAFLEAAELKLRECNRDEAPLSVAVIDVDDFRELNARQGRAAGDAALAGIAAHLRRLTRTGDVLGRSGSDEITVVMPHTDLDGARSCCERLIRELAVSDLPPAGVVSVSAGMSTRQVGMSLGDLLSEAQSGVDRARALGGGRIEMRLADGLMSDPAHTAIVDALAGTLLARDRYTGEHSESVVKLARGVGKQLAMCPGEIETLAAAAHLHDIGKVGIPDRILNKPGALDNAEWDLMREHPVIGERILRAIPGMSPVARIVRHEHERWNGSGYPDNLLGDQIPLGSRIILACDAYSAITTDRPYRKARSHGEALAELTRCAGTQFDPKVTEALIGCLYWERQSAQLAVA